MGDQPEARFKRKVVALLERRIKEGVPVFPICPSDSFYRGISDLLICVNGLYVAVELKIATPVSELQRLFLAHVKRAHGVAGILRKRPEDLVWTPIEANGKDAKFSRTYHSLEDWLASELGI